MDTKFAGLLDDQSRIIIVAGYEDRLWVRLIDRRERSAKILVVLTIGLLRDDSAAHLLKCGLKVAAEPGAIGLVLVGKNGGSRHIQTVMSKAGDDRRLERIDEADAKNIIADLSHRSFGGRRGDHRHFVVLADPA